MKKVLSVLVLLFCGFSAYAADMTAQQAKEELNDRGYLFGCNPVNKSFSEPFRYGFNLAAMHNKVDIMELEAAAGLDITSCGNNLPLVLISKNNIEALEFLLKNGYKADMTVQGYSLLVLSEHYKNAEIVKLLIDNGADVNFVSKKIVPLNYAIKKKQPEIVKTLLEAGAKPDEKTQKLVNKSKNQEIKRLFNK